MGHTISFADSAEELDQVFRLRYKTYAHELHREVSTLDHEKLIEKAPEDDYCRHILAAVNGKVSGTMRVHWCADHPVTEHEEHIYSVSKFTDLVSPEQICIVDKMITDPGQRGGVVAYRIFMFFAQFSIEKNMELVFCTCEPHLVSLYNALGFVSYKETVDYPGIGCTVPLVYVLQDIEHAKVVKSPFLGDALYNRPCNEDLLKRIKKRLPASPAVTALHDYNWEAGWQQHSDINRMVSAGMGKLFENLSKTQIASVASKSLILHLPANAELVRPGNMAKELYVVLEGELEARHDGEVLERMDEGTVFGEIAFLLEQGRSAQVVSVSNATRVLSISDTVLEKFMRSEPGLTAQLMKNLAVLLARRLLKQTAI